MPDCKVLDKCIFFNDQMANMPAMADHYKKKYCQKDNGTCARWVVLQALGREKVPADLFPNQWDRAQQIVAAG
jgi:hypothetical protein